jgi:hypothetical protein
LDLPVREGGLLDLVFYGLILGRYLARHGKTITENLSKTSGVIAEGLSVSVYQ